MEFFRKAYIYSINNINGDILYIGSTYDINDRQKTHNKKLIDSDSLLYKSLRELGISNIELKIIKEFDSYYYKVKNGIYTSYKLFMEEKYIKHCVEKGIYLYNKYYPMEYKDGKSISLSDRVITYKVYPSNYLFK